MHPFFKRISLFSALLYLSSCSINTDFVPIEVDSMIGKGIASQIDLNQIQYPILDETKNKKVYEYLNNIVGRILSSGHVVQRQNFAWKLKVIEDDSTLNAFCVSGGYIYVYTGLIKYLESEDELAGVLAHEIAHADLRHTTDQMIQKLGLSLVLQLVFGSDFGTLAQAGIELLDLSFSRAAEAEADEFAVLYLYHTDYDARGVARFFEKLLQDNKDAKIPAFLSTHPNSSERVRAIFTKWEQLGSKEGKRFEPEYEAVKKLLPAGKS